jgi:DNA-binding CsgD family transcriptional regulator
MNNKDSLSHIGIKRRSGRYPWGSGKQPYQSAKDFLSYLDALRKEGMSDIEISRYHDIKTTELRTLRSAAIAEKRAADAALALRLKDKGYSYVAIGRRMGINESSVRSLLDPALQERSNVAANVAEVLRKAIDTQKYIDVGKGVENHLNIARTKLKVAIAMLKAEGYNVYYPRIPQQGTDKRTSMMVLTAPDVTYDEMWANRVNIARPNASKLKDFGRSILGVEPIESISSDRLAIRYAKEGGSEKDGIIELRKGVPDLSLGHAKYAQVRIGIDGTHFLKGMAMYSNDLPKGVDILFNSKDEPTGNKLDALKKMKINKDTGEVDQDNPFGAVIRPQRKYIDTDGKQKVSAINVVNEEGNWSTWTKNISSQMLSKQKPAVAERQLKLLYDAKLEEFNEIQKLTNPTVKRFLLKPFSDEVDASAVNLEAAGLPRQAWAVILPFPGMKENEVFAPNHRDGESVALIRFPHGGTFEIPIVKVNNKYPEAKDLIGQAKDAIGIHPTVAKRLSGADFDGDTVLVIPNDKGVIKNSPALKGLKDFDPITEYPSYPGMKPMSKHTKGVQMGNVTNLITDMTIAGAPNEDIAKAIRHSMVVIDAEKHKLNYKQSEKDHNIAALKEKYQGSAKAGASTLLSRSTADIRVDHRLDKVDIDPETGKNIYTPSGQTYTRTDKKGNTIVVKRTSVIKRGDSVDDAYELSSGSVIESVYAEHANRLKALANRARKELKSTPSLEYSPSAFKVYAEEVASLKAKLNIALMNKPLERRAQLLAASTVEAKVKSSTDEVTPQDLKKLRGQSLVEARTRTGAKKTQIEITKKEWDAIQAGAITDHTLSEILSNSNLDIVKGYATPRTTGPSLSKSKTTRAKTLLGYGYTQAEVADALGVSVNALSEALAELKP